MRKPGVANTAIAAFLLLSGCNDKSDEPAPRVTDPPGVPANTCIPDCDERECGDDGCGSSCGTCAETETCVVGQCEVQTNCDQTCAELGQACGTHCGEPCGICSEGFACVAGRCECAPNCTAERCGEDDGCGGECGPCDASSNCTDCQLQLSVVERQASPEAEYVTLAIDYAASPTAPLPTLADLRLHVDGAELSRVALGESLLNAHKELLENPRTGKPFQELPGGNYQLVVFSSNDAGAFEPGRLLFLRFRLDGIVGRPATFNIIAREQIFAPAAADQLLWGGGYDGVVAVWPRGAKQ